jgi:hypothetical protein
MGVKRLRSRILQYFSKTLLEELYRVCMNPVISDNNLKVSAMLDLLNKHNVDYVELGPGTNRLAVLIDNYVFKIALDKWGMRDNLNEFTVSQELQPYVVKTYETNELISVCEYVTLISREEFEEQKDVIRSILSILAESYLLGDVGTVSKNFCNWGYRDNGELVILDFAYIYRVQGDELLCSKDQSILEYDENFHNLRCPTCGKKYTFMDVRRKITMEQEKRENDIAKQLAYKLSKPVQEFNEGYKDEDEKSSSLYRKRENVNDIKKEESTMKRRDDYFISREESEESYNEALELMKKMMKGVTDDEVSVVQNVTEDTTTNIVEIHKETPNEKSHIRIIKQTTGNNNDEEVINNEESVMEFIEDVVNEVQGFSNMEKVVEEANEVFEELVLDTANTLEESKEVPVEFEDQHVYAIKAMKMDEEETTEVELTTVSVFDVDNDGDNEIVIDHEKVEVSSGQTDDNNVTEYLVNIDDYEPEDDEEMTEEDVEEYNVYEEDDEEAVEEETGDDESEGEIVYTNEIKLNDNISITNTVKVKADDDEIERLRNELSGDIEEEEIDEDRINELAQQYIHLEEEADREYINRRKGNKNWK